MENAFSILKQIKGENVLDAATGRGDFINVLRKNLGSYVQIIGVDSSEKSIEYAQKLFPDNDIEIYQMDLQDLQFEDGSFDLVSLANSLHHLDNQKVIFTELMRVLKPGGTFLLTEMYQDGEQSEAQQTHILMHHWLASIDRRFGLYHQETYTREEILKIVKKLKLSKLNIIDFYQPVDNPKEARNCEQLRRNIAETFKRLENFEDGAELTDAGKAIVERINNVGCASPSRLLITGVKPKPRSS
ncbi:MAG: class I SAM-dependent methyltransferase [Candidatus Syntrophosphaera sp.]|nr:class I SAM-dependent methyltransferase [Candidatus Syntrophosphaera sp.]